VPLIAYFLIHPLVTALAFVPITPAGIGVQDFGIIGILGLLGVPVAVAGALHNCPGMLILEDLIGLPQIVKSTSLLFSNKKPQRNNTASNLSAYLMFLKKLFILKLRILEVTVTFAHIRLASPSDMSRLKEIINASFPRFYRHFSNRSVTSKTGAVLVSEDNGIVAGFVRLTEFNLGGRRFGCVFWLAVHPRFRRKGLAGGLIKAGVDWLLRRGAVAVFATVGRGNVGSIGAFEGVGFVCVGFLGLWRLFGWRVFRLYCGVWFFPYEVLLMYGVC
jgi:GNAT superfamily N-acetyltransferase